MAARASILFKIMYQGEETRLLTKVQGVNLVLNGAILTFDGLKNMIRTKFKIHQDRAISLYYVDKARHTVIFDGDYDFEDIIFQNFSPVKVLVKHD